MPRLALFMAVLLLLAGVPRPGGAIDASDPMDQYQANFKRKNLGPTLGIDQTKVERLLQIDQKYKSLKRQAIRDAKGALQQLHRVMRQPQPSEQEVAAILAKMMKLRQKKLSLEQRQLQEEKSVLTPVQQARYILLLMNMRQQVAKEAEKVRSAPRGVPMPAKPGPREVPVSRPGRGY
jgi:Spy/CpxP family protein refolding chaperone